MKPKTSPHTLLGLALLAGLLSGCINQRLTTAKISRESATAIENLGSADALKISSVTLSSSGGSASSGYVASIFFDLGQSSVPISNYCTPSGSDTGTTAARPCLCQYAWQEVNASDGSSAVAIPRIVHTAVTTVQPSLVGCNAPEIYQTEIADGTLIKISVIPAPTNPETFNIAAFNYTKSKSAAGAGSFQDAQGRSFMNILRYSCYDQRKRGMSIQSKMSQIDNPVNQGDFLNFPIGNRFCVQKANTNEMTQEGCDTMPAPDHSAQTYYFNLFIRESEMGDINPGNSRYVCPTVKEALSGSSGGIGSQGKYWPLDTTFALSLAKTVDFSIGVVANSKASNPGDPTATTTSCEGTGSSSGSGNAGGLAASCLGFAAKPNSDGTCPYFRDASGSIRFTYRLRRYIALYPPVFDTNGTPLQEPQATDTIYVVDRPVSSSTNPDPLKPYTMHGPKPCPFAYYDHKAVLDGADAPSYAGTNDTRWTGKNVDGIELPRLDGPASCSASVPIVNADRTIMALTTIHPSNAHSSYQRLFIRPITAWAPYYVEDSDFQACAPLATPFRDAPLHFAKNGTNVAWCAEAYPTQNDNVARMDPENLYPGKIKPFTSHVKKNLNGGGAACTATAVTLPANYPADGAPFERARHKGAEASTCDRTVVNPLDGLGWPRFPLLAPASDVEALLTSSTGANYACTMTFDNGGAKTNKASPSGGCCGTATQVVSGAGGAANAHLEPGSDPATPACQMPQY
ncbi:MAG: hypothetical protein NDJ90_06350 [Oligoflexia bacterium]|nr:hypothetical protein [Oligoflexia bacterium]